MMMYWLVLVLPVAAAAVSVSGECISGDPCQLGSYTCVSQPGQPGQPGGPAHFVYIAGDGGERDGVITPPCEPMDSVTRLLWDWSSDSGLETRRRLLRTSFQNFPNLETVDIHGTVAISHIDDGCFRDLGRLRRLSITSVINEGIIEDSRRTPFDGMRNLTDLELKGNNIWIIAPGKLANLTSLERLSLADNPLGLGEPSDLGNAGISELSSLKMLRLTSTYMENMLDMEGLVNLEELYLDMNRLTNVNSGDFTGLANLRRISLDNNLITEVSVGAFTGLDHLEYLDLDNNRIGSVSAEMFMGAPQLRHIYLNENDLSSLARDTFAGLVHLESVYVVGNERLPCEDISALTLHRPNTSRVYPTPDQCTYSPVQPTTDTTNNRARGHHTVTITLLASLSCTWIFTLN